MGRSGVGGLGQSDGQSSDPAVSDGLSGGQGGVATACGVRDLFHAPLTQTDRGVPARSLSVGVQEGDQDESTSARRVGVLGDEDQVRLSEGEAGVALSWVGRHDVDADAHRRSVHCREEVVVTHGLDTLQQVIQDRGSTRVEVALGQLAIWHGSFSRV